MFRVRKPMSKLSHVKGNAPNTKEALYSNFTVKLFADIKLAFYWNFYYEAFAKISF